MSVYVYVYIYVYTYTKHYKYSGGYFAFSSEFQTLQNDCGAVSQTAANNNDFKGFRKPLRKRVNFVAILTSANCFLAFKKNCSNFEPPLKFLVFLKRNYFARV